ncbi:MAG: response regulator transcription factor [Ignavibacteria bacterium]|nr:response regulator transcription factor [Ignavibacteria bacterium]
MLKVVLIEDDKLIRTELEQMLNSSDTCKCAGSFMNCETALKELKSIEPDVILLDIELPGMSGIEGIKKIKELLPECDIIMLTVHEESESIFNALKKGAVGYLDKSASEEKILEAITDVYNGGAPMTPRIARKVLGSFKENESSLLTDREKDVLESLCAGNSYKEIAFKLKITVGTVRHHIKNIYAKLHVHSKSEAVAKALKEKLV